jgi:chromosome segregation ATPase
VPVRFRDRFFTPQVARAITSPSGILLAGLGASAMILVGALPLAPVAAAIAWGVRVAAAIPRPAAGPSIDPFALGEPWRRFVSDALKARERFKAIVETAQPGPLKTRLLEIAERMNTGVDESWRIAKRGQLLVAARAQIDTEGAQRELADVERDASSSAATKPALDRTAESLRAQLATAQRLQTVIDDAYSRLRLLDARLDEALARSAELSVEASDVESLTGLGDDVDSLVTEMESLRQALEETSRGPSAATGTA